LVLADTLQSFNFREKYFPKQSIFWCDDILPSDNYFLLPPVCFLLFTQPIMCCCVIWQEYINMFPVW